MRMGVKRMNVLWVMVSQVVVLWGSGLLYLLLGGGIPAPPLGGLGQFAACSSLAVLWGVSTVNPSGYAGAGGGGAERQRAKFKTKRGS